MSTSIAAQSIAARKSKSSRKATSRNLLGAAALGCVVLGSGWTVYSKIFAASVFPTLRTAGDNEPVIKPGSKGLSRDMKRALLPDQVQVVAPISRDMFNDRFSAAIRLGIESNEADVAQVDESVISPASGKAVKVALLPDEVQVVTPISRDMFNDRFSAAIQQGVASNAANAAPATTVAEAKGTLKRTLALNEPAQGARVSAKPGSREERAKAAVMSIASHERQSIVDKLWGKSQPSGGLLAYASADTSIVDSIAPKEQNPMFGGSPPYDRSTAVYDISAKTVYLPDGSKLEAHSGLGSGQDDPRSANLRMRGVTPPHIYTLKPRESLFHGVPALRLTPMGGEKAIYGRDGLLAHTFMLGSKGASNGCVSFRDYYAFLDAYRNKGIRKIAVLARVD